MHVRAFGAMKGKSNIELFVVIIIIIHIVQTEQVFSF